LAGIVGISDPSDFARVLGDIVRISEKLERLLPKRRFLKDFFLLLKNGARFRSDKELDRAIRRIRSALSPPFVGRSDVGFEGEALRL
jgi:hypothetical protein